MPSHTKRIVPAENARVLLIEEHASNMMITRKLLERFGIKNVYIASNGIVGINMLRQSKPDLILMDCTMPGLDGYDATRLIRMKESESGIDASVPIIGLTANTSGTAKDNCTLAGMNACAHKPIDPVQMHSLLSEYIQLRGFKLPEIDSNESGTDNRIDLSVVAQFARAGREPLEMLITAYIAESAELLKTLRKTFDDCDTLKWAQTIHKLRGASANIGAREVMMLTSHRQERMPSVEVGDSILMQLEAACDFACTQLKAYMEENSSSLGYTI